MKILKFLLLVLLLTIGVWASQGKSKRKVSLSELLVRKNKGGSSPVKHNPAVPGTPNTSAEEDLTVTEETAQDEEEYKTKEAESFPIESGIKKRQGYNGVTHKSPGPGSQDMYENDEDYHTMDEEALEEEALLKQEEKSRPKKRQDVKVGPKKLPRTIPSDAEDNKDVYPIGEEASENENELGESETESRPTYRVNKHRPQGSTSVNKKSPGPGSPDINEEEDLQNSEQEASETENEMEDLQNEDLVKPREKGDTRRRRSSAPMKLARTRKYRRQRSSTVGSKSPGPGSPNIWDDEEVDLADENAIEEEESTYPKMSRPKRRRDVRYIDESYLNDPLESETAYEDEGELEGDYYYDNVDYSQPIDNIITYRRHRQAVPPSRRDHHQNHSANHGNNSNHRNHSRKVGNFGDHIEGELDEEIHEDNHDRRRSVLRHRQTPITNPPPPPQIPKPNTTTTTTMNGTKGGPTTTQATICQRLIDQCNTFAGVVKAEDKTEVQQQCKNIEEARSQCEKDVGSDTACFSDCLDGCAEMVLQEKLWPYCIYACGSCSYEENSYEEEEISEPMPANMPNNMTSPSRGQRQSRSIFETMRIHRTGRN